MKKFKCLKKFTLNLLDEDECVVENESFIVEKGTIWELQEFSYLCDNRLESSDLCYIEISDEYLSEFFEEVPENDSN